MTPSLAPPPDIGKRRSLVNEATLRPCRDQELRGGGDGGMRGRRRLPPFPTVATATTDVAERDTPVAAVTDWMGSKHHSCAPLTPPS